jgi:GAF domain-containing protein
VTERFGPGGGPFTPETLLAAVTETVRKIHDAPDLAAATTVLAESAARHLGADVAAVILQPRRGVTQRLASTDAVLLPLDDVEQAPMSPQAVPLHEGEAVLVRDTATDERWPEWSASANARGLRSALFTGLPAVRDHAVTLELYARRTDGFPRIDSAVATQMVTLVGLALRHADRNTNLEEALHTRGLVGQAQGILMARFDLDGVQAMSFLRRRSQQSQLPVRELAATIVAEAEHRSTGANPDD